MRRCGTESGYSGGCRCVRCKEAHAQVRRNRRHRDKDGGAPVIERPERVPTTVIPIGPWHERAACKSKGRMFLIPADRSSQYRNLLPARNQTAIAMCFRCPVLKQCEQWAMAHQFDPCPHHILAGLTPSQRNVKRRVLGVALPGPTGGAA
jgi:hypothetical protein